MEFFAVLAVLGILSIPVMLVVGLCKLSDIVELLREVRDLQTIRQLKERQEEKIQPKPEPVVAPVVKPEPVVAPVAKPEPVRIPEPETKPGPESVSAPVAKPEPSADGIRMPSDSRGSVPPAPEEPTAIELFWQKVGDWFFVRGEFAPAGTTHEFALATHWLVRVGVVMIIASLAYFAKLSIDRGWMGPTGRVVATLIWGAIGVAAILSVCLASSPIAVLALIGGYLVPIIAGRDTGSPLGLDIYLVVINLGAFVVTRFRKWSPLDFLASILGFVMCFVWCSRHPNCGPAAVLTNFVFISIVHLIYMASVVFGAKFRNRAGNALAWAGLSIGACVYFGWLVSYFRMGFSNGTTGLVLLGVVAVYLAVAVFALRRGLADTQTVNILLVFALAFLAIAPAFIFDEMWLTLIWSVLSVAMIEAERRTGQKVLSVMAYLTLAAAAVVGFYVVSKEYQSAYKMVNATTSQYLIALFIRLLRVACLPVAIGFVACRTKLVELKAVTGILVFLCYTAEAVMFGRAFLPSFGTGMVTVAWTVAALAGVWTGISRRVRALRIGSLVLLGVSVAKLLLFDTAHLPTPGRVGVFAIVGVFLLIGAFFYIRARDKFEVHE